MKSLKRSTEKPIKIPQLRGIKKKRKDMILQNLTDLIPENRRQFWEHLPINDKVADLRTVYEDI